MYEVAVLFECSLNHMDVEQLLSLHEGVDDEVTYHLLMHMKRPDMALSASMAAFTGGPIMPAEDPETLKAVNDEIQAECEGVLRAAMDEFVSARGTHVTSTLSEDDPVEALVDLVAEHNCAEAVILTDPHHLQEFLRMDWASRARRKLKVPIVHLLEHRASEDDTNEEEQEQ